MRRTVISRVSSATKQQRPARSRNVPDHLRLLRCLVSILDDSAHTPVQRMSQPSIGVPDAIASTVSTAMPAPTSDAPRPTTFVEAPRLAAHLGVVVFLATETFQRTGSFKFRAA